MTEISTQAQTTTITRQTMGSHHVFIHLTNQGLSESPLGPVWLSLTSPVCPNETVPSTDQTYLQRCADEMTFKFGWHSQVPLKHLAATGQKGFPQGSGTSQGAHSLGVLSSHSSLFLGVLRPLRVRVQPLGPPKCCGDSHQKRLLGNRLCHGKRCLVTTFG